MTNYRKTTGSAAAVMGIASSCDYVTASSGVIRMTPAGIISPSPLMGVVFGTSKNKKSRARCPYCGMDNILTADKAQCDFCMGNLYDD